MNSVHSYAGDFLDVQASPSDTTLILAASAEIQDGKPRQSVVLLSLVDPVCEVKSSILKTDGRVKSLLWESSETVIVSTNSAVHAYRVRESASCTSMDVLEVPDCGVSVIDPHHSFTVAVASDKSLLLWDRRAKSASLTFKTSHFFPILSLDANPSIEHQFVTGGADGRVMFWDIRQPSGSVAIKAVEAHNHHVTCVKYNTLHDQLLLTSGTDCAVNLWRFPSISSSPNKPAPLTENVSRTSAISKPVSPASDGLIHQYNRHEDTVHKLCWSVGRSSWSFASVSYDGLVMFNSVPTQEKYRIMV